MILHEAPHKVSIRDAGGNLFPASTTIFADEQIRGKITVLMVIQRNIHGIRIMKIGSDVVDKRSIGDTR